MKPKVCFIHRKNADTPSIERVFSVISQEMRQRGIEVREERLPFGNSLAGLIGNLLFFRKTKADIYHITGHVHYIALRLPPEQTVLTVHDLGILKTRRGFRRNVIKRLFFDWPFRRLRYITAISLATKQDILSEIGPGGEKTIVVSNPVSQEFSNERRQLNENEPSILQVGTAPHKNLSIVIEAVAGLACKLIIVGHLKAEMLARLRNLEIDFENPKANSDEAMRAVYQRSDILVFCSTFEGFGLPIIEAQSMRLPVITSNIGPMNEVADGAAILVDPLDAAEIQRAIESVTHDRDLRERLVQKGIENIQRFHPSKIVDQYLEVYGRILSKESTR